MTVPVNLICFKFSYLIHEWLSTILAENPKTAEPVELLNATYAECIASRIFLTMPVTVASAEHSFSRVVRVGRSGQDFCRFPWVGQVETFSVFNILQELNIVDFWLCVIR
jgi:hypothetical protein